MPAVQILASYPRANITSTFTGTAHNQNLYALLGTLPYAVDLRFVNHTNGFVGSPTTGSASFRTTGSWAHGSWLRVTNAGTYGGCGGTGGGGGVENAPNGLAGGTGGVAFDAEWPVSLDNTNGKIYGGGGGGGGGGAAYTQVIGFPTVGDGGGGGGGGGGYVGGAGGPGGSTPTAGTAGQTGTWTAGGTGGAPGDSGSTPNGGAGGHGGNAGAAGTAGVSGNSGSTANGAGGAGGAAGRYINGTANIVWLGTGDVRGNAA